MNPVPPDLTDAEKRALIGLCLLAALADGAETPEERAALQRALGNLREPGFDVDALAREAFAGKLEARALTRELLSPAARSLAYELALGTCDSDGATTEKERSFLTRLREDLGLEERAVHALDARAGELASVPLAQGLTPGAASAPANDADLDAMIRNHALLAGALELLPGTLDTLAILGVQMKLVHAVGKRYGFELQRSHLQDFLAVLGVGLTSQVLEGYARRVLGGLFGRVAGGLAGGLIGGAVGPALSFATTYALGHVAQRYYAGGRKLSAGELKELFSSLLSRARDEGQRSSAEIARRASELGSGDVLGFLRSR